MRTCAAIQARYNSTRFPGKALALFMGKPIIRFIYDRVLDAVDEVVVATTYDSPPIIDYCNHNNIKHVEGFYNDCVGRMMKAMDWVGADLVVRLWGDSPLINPVLIKEYLDKMGDSDCATTVHPRATIPKGMDFEIYTRNCLSELYQKAEGKDKEFPIEYILRNNFKVLNILLDYSIDYPEDVERVEREYRRIYSAKQV